MYVQTYVFLSDRKALLAFLFLVVEVNLLYHPVLLNSDSQC